MKRIFSILTVVVMIFSLFAVVGTAKEDELKEQKIEKKESQDYVASEILVKYKGEDEVVKIVKVKEGKEKEEVEKYKKKVEVEYAELNYIAWAHGTVVPDDPFFDPYQWHLMDASVGGMNAWNAWDTTTGEGIVVAVIDTGVAYSNFRNFVQAPDLKNTSFTDGWDFVNNDARPNDDEGHGTHVAGTIAQSTNNGLGVAGVAYGATIMPIKVLNSSGSGSYYDIAAGIDYAVANGADVINMSLGGDNGATVLETAVRNAYEAGVVVVASSGNDNRGSVGYPAAYDQYVIAVGASGYGGSGAGLYRSPYSNYGSKLDLMAPGGDTSVDLNGDGYGDGVLQNTFGNNVSDFSYFFYQGTSMAAPHVAGAAALLIAGSQHDTPDEVEAALAATAVKFPGQNQDWTEEYGYGLIDVAAALAWTPPTTGGNNAPVAVDDDYTVVEDGSVAIVLSATDGDGDSLSYSVTSDPANGSLSGTGSNLTYQPGSNYYGSDSFTFKVNDGQADSNEATISITVSSLNDAPTAEDISVSGTVGEAIAITLLGSDVEDSEEALIYDLVTEPAGQLTGTAPDLVYTSDAAGTDSFTYSVRDTSGASVTGEVTITIEAVVEPPQAAVYTAVVTESLRGIGRGGGKVTGSASADILVDGQPVAGGLTVTGKWTWSEGESSIETYISDDAGTIESSFDPIYTDINYVEFIPVEIYIGDDSYPITVIE